MALKLTHDSTHREETTVAIQGYNFLARIVIPWEVSSDETAARIHRPPQFPQVWQSHRR